MSDRSTSPEELLAGVELFSSLSRRRLKKLAEVSRIVNHESGTKVAAEGLGALGFHLVVEGAASVQQGGATIRTLAPGDYFGEISMIDGKPRSASVVAEGPLTTLVVPHQSFQSLLDSDSAFVRELLLLLCARLRATSVRAGDAPT